MKLGDIVALRFPFDIKGTYVIAGEPSKGRVRVVYCATQRWQLAEMVPVEAVNPRPLEDRNTKRARRWLDAARGTADPDGWIRIQTGKPWNHKPEIVGHVDIPWERP